MHQLIRFSRGVQQARPFETEALAALKQLYVDPDAEDPYFYYLPEDFGNAHVSAQWIRQDDEGAVDKLVVLFRIRSTKVFPDDPNQRKPYYAEAMIRDGDGAWQFLIDFYADGPMHRMTGEMLQGGYSISGSVDTVEAGNVSFRYVYSPYQEYGSFYTPILELVPASLERGGLKSRLEALHGKKAIRKMSVRP